MRNIPTFAFLAPLIVFIACQGSSLNSDAQYSVSPFAEKTSILVDIDYTGRISICIQERIPTFVKTQGISDAAVAARLSEVKGYAESAINTWLSFLKDNKFWRRKAVNIEFFVGTVQCASKPPNAITIETDVGPARLSTANS
jgi:hypothetical protein